MNVFFVACVGDTSVTLSFNRELGGTHRTCAVAQSDQELDKLLDKACLKS